MTPQAQEPTGERVAPGLPDGASQATTRLAPPTGARQEGPDFVLISTPEGDNQLPADTVFPLIGYEPDFALFERCGIRPEGENRVPAHDPETLESNVPGIYLAGAILGGREIGKIFIENSRHHAGQIAGGWASRLGAAHSPADRGSGSAKRSTGLSRS